MPEVNPVPAMYLALEETPGDSLTLFALADWYMEQGHPEATACLRWCAEQNRYPFRYSRHAGLRIMGESWRDGWYWWAVEGTNYGRNWGHSQQCRLPSGLWQQLRHNFDYDPAVFKEYPSLRAAYEALIEAWPRAKATDLKRLATGPHP